MLNNKRSTILLTLIAFVFHISVAIAGPIEDCKEYSILGIPGQQGELMCRKGFLMAHSPVHKTPLWVIEHLTAEKAEGKLPRYNKFKADPDLKTENRAELSDYNNSGYDRGHMAPAADMKWDQTAMTECFYLSNMVPQVGKDMNRGIWKELEEHIRTWAMNRTSIYVFTGPIYNGVVNKTIGKNKVTVPTQLYKVVYDPQKNEAISFIMPNEEIKDKDMLKYVVTVREVEEKTGLNFLSNIEQTMQDEIETKVANKLW